MVRAWRFVGLVLVSLLLATCDTGAPSHSVVQRPVDRPADPTQDQALLVALAQARNYHHLADVQLADGNVPAAIAAVEAILRVQFPPGAPEGEETLLDARARLAKLYLGAGRLDEAQRVVDEGLAAPHDESFFLANLHAVSGDVHEARAHALDGVDETKARAERRLAIEALERSIQINERVQVRIRKEARP